MEPVAQLLKLSVPTLVEIAEGRMAQTIAETGAAERGRYAASTKVAPTAKKRLSAIQSLSEEVALGGKAGTANIVARCKAASEIKWDVALEWILMWERTYCGQMIHLFCVF